MHNERLTNPAQERLAQELTEVAPEGFTRARFVTSGSDANEMAVQLARSYHVERGEPQRWEVISPAQAYHGPTMQTLALTGRPGLQRPFGPYLREHPHIPPSTWRFDPTGQAALDALDRVLESVGPENVSAYFCEAISAAALPAYTPPDRFWRGLAERRDRHGFLVCFDEVVTGVGRTGNWFAGNATPCRPDIIATAKGLGAGYAAIGAVLCDGRVYDAFANGSRRFTLGHTWDGAPLSCAVGLAVLDALEPKAWSIASANAVRPSATSSRRPSPASRWCERCAATGSCWESSTSTRATASRSCRRSSASPAGSTAPRSTRD